MTRSVWSRDVAWEGRFEKRIGRAHYARRLQVVSVGIAHHVKPYAGGFDAGSIGARIAEMFVSTRLRAVLNHRKW
jgi:hypothetical protein